MQALPTNALLTQAPLAKDTAPALVPLLAQVFIVQLLLIPAVLIQVPQLIPLVPLPSNKLGYINKISQLTFLILLTLAVSVQEHLVQVPSVLASSRLVPLQLIPLI